MFEQASTKVTAGAVPVPDADSLPFWEGCREGQLRLQHCDDCGVPRFPASPVCDRCRSWSSTWNVVEGVGRVYSWVIVHHAVTAALADEVPYAVALVEIAPGVRIPGRLTGVAHDEIAPDMEVGVTFHDSNGPWPIPGFVPARSVS